MKKYVVVLTAFLLFCGDMLAKNGEVMFWGVSFECRKADLAAAIKAKWNNAIVVDERNGGNNLIWRSKNYPDENLSYEGFEVNSASAEFTQDDSLSRAYVGLVPQKKQNIFELYSLVKRYLEGKYGKPEADYSFFKSPYHKDGGQNNVWAVIEGKCVYIAFWSVPYKKHFVTISMEITPEKQVELTFVNEYKDINKPVLKEDNIPVQMQ